MSHMRNSTRVVFGLVSLIALTLGMASANAAPTPWFDGRVGLAVQVVSVQSTGGSSATVEAWQRGLSGWDRVIGPFDSFIGSDGIAPRAVDGVPATPAGVFSLDSVFGTGPAPGGLLPYRKVGPDDWWDGDPRSSTYNTHQKCTPGTCAFDESESEQLAIPQYEYSVVMGVNAAKVPGSGGAFFMHVTDGTPTLGCVAMDKQSLLRIIRWLMPGSVISIR